METWFLTILRFESIESWRRKLWDAHARYQTASMRCRRLEGIEPGQVRNLKHLLTVARRAESEAAADYVRLIKIGTAIRSQGQALKSIGCK